MLRRATLKYHYLYFTHAIGHAAITSFISAAIHHPLPLTPDYYLR